MIHKAKIDWWIGAAIIAGMTLPFVSAVTTHTRWMYAIGGLVVGLVFGFCYPQSYETTGDALLIRAGLSRQRIPYGEITSVRPSTDSRSAAALSLDRVLSSATGGDALIAPADQQAFFDDLAARTPHLSRRGQDLVITLG